MGYVVKAKVKESEITRDGRIRSTRKDVVEYVQDVVGNNKLLVKFEYGPKKYISSSSLVFLSSKEEVDMDETLYHSTEK